MTFDRRLALLPIVAMLALGTSQFAGCGSEEEEPPPPVRVDPGPGYSVQDVSMDIKVQFPDKYTPMSESLAEAIADFASAIATGDLQAYRSMLNPGDQIMLDILQATGEWEEQSANISAVRIVNLEDGESIAKVALAIGTDSHAELTAWTARRIDESNWQFSALGVAPRKTTRVALLDDATFEEDALYNYDSQMPSEEEDENQEEGDGEEGEDSDDSWSDPGDGSSPSPSSPSSPSSPGSPASPGSPVGP